MSNERSAIVSGAAISGVAGPRVLSGRSKLVLGVSVAAMMAAALAVAPRTSHAVNECGTPTGDTVICTSEGNNYPDGITYFVDDLTIILADETEPVVVHTTGDAEEGVFNAGDGDQAVETDEDVSITTEGLNAEGIFVNAYSGEFPAADGTVFVNNAGDITTSGNGSAGIRTLAEDGATTILNSGIIRTSGDPNPTGGLPNPAHGIYAGSNAGSIDITNLGEVHTQGDAAVGIFGLSASGDVTIDNAGTVTTAGGVYNGFIAAGISAATTGVIDIYNSGSVSTSGEGAIGLIARDGSSVTIDNSGDVTTLGADADGIYASTNNGPVTITNSGSVSTSGAYAEGIYASTEYGPITISNSGEITTTGESSEGIEADSDYGNITVTNSGDITTEADASGIFATTYSGAISITSTGEGDITTDGDAGIFASTGSGAIAISNDGNITTEGGPLASGIDATSFYGAISIAHSGDITTSGADADGIYAETNGGIVISNSGSIVSTGSSSDGIFARGLFFLDAGDPVSITNSGIISATDDGIYALGTSVTVNNSGAIAAGDGDGIEARAFDITVVNSGTISAGGDGIHACAIGPETVEGSFGPIGRDPDCIDADTINITNRGDIGTAGNPVGGTGILAQGLDITVDSSGSIHSTGTGIDADGDSIAITSSGIIGAGTDGIFATGGLVAVTNSAEIDAGDDGIDVSGSDVTVTNAGIIDAGDDGIHASGSTAGATLDITNSGSIAAGGNGIRAESASAVDIDNSGEIFSGGAGIHAAGDLIAISNAGTIETLADGADGIRARGGPIAITSTGTIATEGDDAQGIDARSAAGPITIDNQGDISTIGAGSHGILAVKDGGEAPVANDVNVASSGDITTTGLGASGIVVSNDLGDFDVTVSGTITTSGHNAPAIDAFTAEGSGSVNTVAGVISTLGNNSAGVLAYANGTLDVDVGTVITRGDNSPGVDAFDPISDVTVTALDVTTFGDNSAGIIAGSEVADVTVAVEDVRTQGAHAPGVHAFTGSGDVTVSVFGDVVASGPGSSGVIVDTPDGLQSVFVAADGSITSGPDGSTPAAVLFEGAGTSELENRGLIRAANDLVVSSVSSIATTIDNIGTMIGNVLLGDGPDTFNNHSAGLFRARGDSFFEGGFDRFDNDGTLQVTDGPVTFHDLEVFNNSAGSITMVDDDTNDSLTLPGEYVGGGQLAVDAIIGPDGDSDQLILQGIVSGDPTAVIVNIVDITGPSSEGISVVTLENGAPGDQFFLAGGPIDAGLFQLDLFGEGDGFRLATIPDEGSVGSLMATLPALVALSHEITGRIDRSNEILEAESEEAGDDEEGVPAVAQVHPGSWAKIVGSSVKQDTETSFSLGDTRLRQSDRFDLGLVGIIGGLDIAQSGVRDGTKYAWLVGALGGYVWADVDFATATGTQDIEAGVFGGYGGLAYGPFRMHLLAKMDFGDVTFNEPDLAPGFAGQDKADFRTVSVESNFGYKVQLPNSMYVQPIASLYYSNTELDEVNIGGTTVEFETLDSLRARAGVRFGANLVGEKYVLDPWVQASIWQELLDPDSEVTLSSGGTSLELIGAGVETYGEVGAGVNVVRIGPGWSGQVRADAKFGDLDLLALSGQVGIEYRFPVD